MSFYGSVYYQLVDTFYKIVTKNSDSRNFGPKEYPTEDLETQAIGRKGILSLNAGNKWIAFDQIKDAQGNSTGQGYMIYHAPADKDADNVLCHGFHCQDEDSLERDDEGVIQLTEGLVFETNSYSVDKAGHIIPDTSIRYRLPKTETNDRLNALENWKDQLFWLVNGTMPDQPVEDMDAFKTENPQDKNHEQRISDGEEYDEIVRQIYTKSDYFGDSAEETAKVFFGEDDWSDDQGNARSFVDAFGSIRDIKEEVFGREYAEEHGEDYTVAEAIIKIKGEVDKNAGNIETNLQSATYAHNKFDEELTNHDNRINNIVKMYGKTNSENSEDPEVVRQFTSEHYFGKNAKDDNGIYRNFIDGFGSIDQVISSVFHTSNYDNTTTVSNAIATLAGNAENLTRDFNILQDRVGLTDESGLSKRIATNETDIQAIKDDLGPATKEGSVRHTLVQLDGKISGLGTRHDQELATMDADITANENAIKAEKEAREQAINTEVTDRNTAISEAINTEVTNRNTAISEAINAEVTARDTAIDNAIDAEVTARDTAIDNAVRPINTQLTGENGIVSQISGINGQITRINTQLSERVETSTFEAFKTTNSEDIGKKLDVSAFESFQTANTTEIEKKLDASELNTALEGYVLKSEYDAKIAGLLERLEALEALHPELNPDPEPETPVEGEDEGSTTV